MILILLLLVLITGYMTIAEMWYERDFPRSTWKGLVISLLLLMAGASAFGQASYYTNNVQTINTSAPQPGGLYPVLAIPNSAVAICGYPANATPCTNYATTYTAPSGSTCPSSAQFVRPGTSTCVALADAEGSFGAWVNPGNYSYTVTTSYGSFGPYNFSVGVNIATGDAYYVPTDASYIFNNFAYNPYASPSFGQNVFLGTGSMAWGSGTSGALTGSNVGVGVGALHGAVNAGSVTAVGTDSCYSVTGLNTTDPFDGNDTCVGADSGYGDATMYDTGTFGQKSYTDLTAGSVGGAGGSLFGGVHLDGIDGWTNSVVWGAYNFRYTQGEGTSTLLPVTGTHNTVTGANNGNCDFGSSCAATGAQNFSYNTVTGSENFFDQTAGYNSQYAVVDGSFNLGKFNAGSISGTTVNSNIAIGNYDLGSEVTGVDNVVVANNGLASATSSENTAVGGGSP